MELVVVIVIMATVAALVTVSVSGVAADSREDTTRIALANIRAAIFGDGGRGYYADVRAMPTRIADLFRRPAEVPAYDAATRFGWRGPYLSPQHGFYVIDVADDLVDPFDPYNFTNEYGEAGEPVPLDAWQNPIVLQIPDVDGNTGHSREELRHARLVSAGETGGIDTPRTGGTELDAFFPSHTQCRDDIVLYLNGLDERP